MGASRSFLLSSPEWGPSQPQRELGGTTGESPPREGAVKGGEELRRLEVAAAVLNVFINEEAGEG